jgi:hypothetical protein
MFVHRLHQCYIVQVLMPRQVMAGQEGLLRLLSAGWLVQGP